MVRTGECLHARIVPVHLRAHHTVCLYSVPTKDITVRSGTENVLRKIAAIRKKVFVLFWSNKWDTVQVFLLLGVFIFFLGGGGGEVFLQSLWFFGVCLESCGT